MRRSGIIDEKVEALGLPIEERLANFSHEAVEGTDIPRVEL